MGWCHAEVDEDGYSVLDSGVIDFNKCRQPGMHPGLWPVSVERTIREKLLDFQVPFLISERWAAGKSGAANRSWAVAQVATQMAAHATGVKWFSIQVQDVKKFATGHHLATKQQMLQALRESDQELADSCKDHNEVDAIWVAGAWISSHRQTPD